MPRMTDGNGTLDVPSGAVAYMASLGYALAEESKPEPKPEPKPRAKATK